MITIVRTVVFWGPYWGLLILGNYDIRIHRIGGGESPAGPYMKIGFYSSSWC